jgi:membrane protein YdbS with pleckstrin-like domain
VTITQSCHGADAAVGAFATIYGEAKLTHFEVWAYQVNPQEVSVERCH